MVVDGQSGLFVDAGRPDQLADAVLRLARSNELCRQLASGGRARAVERFECTRMVERHAQFYTTLLAMKP
jgi:glycosyltransferase involved in cell wall biosynthesis